MFGIVATGSAFLVVHFCCAAPPFLQSKNPFLHAKKGVFGVQKYGF